MITLPGHGGLSALYSPAMDACKLLVLNAGSSSLKFALYRAGERCLRGQAGGIGGEGWVDWNGVREARAFSDHEAALGWLFRRLEREGLTPDAAGHRVVHGGARFTAPVRIDETVLAELEALVPLAPLHQPHNLAAMRALARLRPHLPQVACFDTAFHHTLPEVARRYALPGEWEARGVRIYGFHGLSYEAVVHALPAVAGVLPERLIVAHLGAGCSLCAVRAGRSVATTMGLTPLDGVPMATRPGHLDPGVVPYLLRQGLSLEEVEDGLYHRSGWLGVSGRSADMRELLASGDSRARAAVDLFCYRVVCEIGSLAAALGGVEALVFTGGVGENAAEIRARILAGCAWLGFRLDEAANARHGPRITQPDGPAAWVVPTDEEAVIARRTLELLQGEERHEPPDR